MPPRPNKRQQANPLGSASGPPTKPPGRRKKAEPTLPLRSSLRQAAARSAKDTLSRDQEPAREPFATMAFQNSNLTHGNGQEGLAREDSNRTLSEGKENHSESISTYDVTSQASVAERRSERSADKSDKSPGHHGTGELSRLTELTEGNLSVHQDTAPGTDAQNEALVHWQNIETLHFDQDFASAPEHFSTPHGAFVSAPMTVADGIELESDKSYTRYSILTPDEPEPCGSEVGSETIVNSDEDEDEDEGYVCKGFKDEDDEDNYYEDNTEVDQLVDELEEEENFGDEVVRDLPEHTPLRGERTTFHGAEIRFNGEHLHQDDEAVRRSPHRITETMVSDLVSGLKEISEFNLDELATIATAIQEKLKEGRRRNLLEKMQDLLAVPGLATLVQERAERANCDTFVIHDGKDQVKKASCKRRKNTVVNGKLGEGGGSGKETTHSGKASEEFTIQTTIPIPFPNRDHQRAQNIVPTPKPMPAHRDLQQLKKGLKSKFSDALKAAKGKTMASQSDSRSDPKVTTIFARGNAEHAEATGTVAHPDLSYVDVVSVHLKKIGVARPRHRPQQPQQPAIHDSSPRASRTSHHEGSELQTSSHPPPAEETDRTRGRELQGPTGVSRNKMKGRAMNSHPKEGDGRDQTRGKTSQQPLDAPPYKDASHSRKDGKEVDRSRGETVRKFPSAQAGFPINLHSKQSDGGNPSKGSSMQKHVRASDNGEATYAGASRAKDREGRDRIEPKVAKSRGVGNNAPKHVPLKEADGRDRAQGQCKSGVEHHEHASAAPKSQQSRGNTRVPERNQVGPRNAPTGTADFEAEFDAPLQIPCFDDDLLDDGVDVGRSMKRRKGKRKHASGKAQDNEQYERIDIDGKLQGDDDDDHPEPASQMPSQITKYSGKAKEVMERARSNIQIYLLKINGFPTVEEFNNWSHSAYKYAGIYVYGDKCELYLPPFDNGIKKLLSTEVWALRGRMKRHVVRLIDKFYPIHPRGGLLVNNPNPTIAARRFVEQKVAALLGKEALYLSGVIEPEGKPVSYAHPAIRELIHIMIFSKKSRPALASVDLDSFDPIPLPLIAYVCTALLNGLEEYKTGIEITKDFSAANYADIYLGFIESLKRMDTKTKTKPILTDLRRRILSTGRSRLFGDASATNRGPPIPHFASSDVEEDGNNAAGSNLEHPTYRQERNHSNLTNRPRILEQNAQAQDEWPEVAMPAAPKPKKHKPSPAEAARPATPNPKKRKPDQWLEVAMPAAPKPKKHKPSPAASEAARPAAPNPKKRKPDQSLEAARPAALNPKKRKSDQWLEAARPPAPNLGKRKPDERADNEEDFDEDGEYEDGEYEEDGEEDGEDEEDGEHEDGEYEDDDEEGGEDGDGEDEDEEGLGPAARRAKSHPRSRAYETQYEEEEDVPRKGYKLQAADYRNTSIAPRYHSGKDDTPDESDGGRSAYAVETRQNGASRSPGYFKSAFI